MGARSLFKNFNRAGSVETNRYVARPGGSKVKEE